MRIYVGNLDYAMTSDDLRSLFEPFGEVASAEVQVRSRTGQSRGRPRRSARRRCRQTEHSRRSFRVALSSSSHNGCAGSRLPHRVWSPGSSSSSCRVRA